MLPGRPAATAAPTPVLRAGTAGLFGSEEPRVAGE